MTTARRPPGPGASRLAITLAGEGTITVLRLEGELDLASVAQLRRSVRLALADFDPEWLLLDLSELSFTDSMGLATLVWAHKAMDVRGRKLHLVRPQPLVCRLLRVTGLDTRLHIAD